VAELAARIGDGCSLAVPSDAGGASLATTRALIRRRARDLHLIGVPTSGLQADLLIGAGCVRKLEISAVSLAEHGLAPRFSLAVKRRELQLLDATCPAIHAGLTAAEKGVPFMPMRGLIGSDLVRWRSDWITIGNPFADGPDPIVLIPAIRPDVALFHVALADRFGNVWVGMRRELMTLAHAAHSTLVTAEEIDQGNLLADPVRGPGVIPSVYVTAVAAAPRGAWPLGLAGRYAPDDAHLAGYARLAWDDDGFRGYLREHVLAESAK